MLTHCGPQLPYKLTTAVSDHGHRNSISRDPSSDEPGYHGGGGDVDELRHLNPPGVAVDHRQQVAEPLQWPHYVNFHDSWHVLNNEVNLLCWKMTNCLVKMFTIRFSVMCLIQGRGAGAGSRLFFTPRSRSHSLFKKKSSQKFTGSTVLLFSPKK